MIAMNFWVSTAILCFAPTFRESEPMTSYDIEAPEQVLFLPTAAKAMNVYRDHHGEYPREWRSLDINFKQNDRPTQQNKNLWQPKGCEYVYQIVSADKEHFLIQALGWEDKPVYEIRDGMKELKALPGAHVKPAKLNPDVPEPKLFLPAAAAAMKAQYGKERQYPSKWNYLEITYAAIPHHIYDRNVRPGEYNTEYWRPRGCDYTYRLSSFDKHHFLIQAIGKMSKVEYEIRDGMTEAQFIQEPGPLVDHHISY